MNINELDSYNLADAVKFHRRLNPRIWGRDEHLLPEVRERLLAIAADFQEFLGVEDLDVQDITVSGSNAAYSYTKNSDIDLHLVVAMPDNPVYQELFNAKKYQYNDEHNIKIGGADVELYVQPADQEHHSQGIYSIKNNEWISIPQRKRAQVDDACVRDKVADLDARIHTAVKSKNADAIATLWNKIKAMRKAGLEQHGEFGCENISFKILRNSGCIRLLKDAMTAAQDRELSLREAPQKKFRYGFAEGHQGQPYSSEDGVAASTKMYLSETDDEHIVTQFIQHTASELGIDPMPEIHLHTDPEWSVHNHSFGRYDPDSHTLNVSMPNRHILDVLRTVAHELVHCEQHQRNGHMPDDAGETGSRWENDANARAGIIMRDWANTHPEHFEHEPLEENASGYIPKNKKEAARPQYAMALSVDVHPGEVGRQANKLALHTGRNGEPGLLMRTANLRESLDQTGVAEGESTRSGIVQTEVYGTKAYHAKCMEPGCDWQSKRYDRIKQAQVAAQQHAEQHVGDSLAESLAQEFALLEAEFLPEVKMTGKNLAQLASKIPGVKVGLEFEMIVPGTSDSDEDFEADYDQDERVRDIDEAVDFFDDGDYNSRGDIQRLRAAMENDYFEWQSEQMAEQWDRVGFGYFSDYLEREDPFNEEEAEEEARNQLQGQYGDELTGEEFEQMLTAMVDEQRESYVQDQWDEQGNNYDYAREEFEQEMRDNGDFSESEWLRDQGIRMASDVESNYGYVTWPHYTSGGDSETDIKEVALDFVNNSGLPYKRVAVGKYHGYGGYEIWNGETWIRGTQEKPNYCFTIEPDGSLEGNDDQDTGLEFVSPPIPLDQVESVMQKVQQWAGTRGAYTGLSNATGLHTNISIPGYSIDKLDYVKAALLLGDEHVLREFDRIGNTYAKPAIEKVRNLVKQKPEKAQQLLDKMKSHLDAAASKIIHSGVTDKYTSINTKDNRIEFRSPGGDYLSDIADDPKKMIDTINRMVVVMDAALNPEKYKQEYQKKLYKALTGQQSGRVAATGERQAAKKDDKDLINIFSRYAAGELPRQALKSFVRQAQLERKLARGDMGEKYWWEVSNPGHSDASIRVVATNKKEAIEQALKPDGYPSWKNTISTVQARPLQPFSDEPLKARAGEPEPVGRQADTQNYELYDRTTGAVIDTFPARDDNQALTRLNDYRNFGAGQRNPDHFGVRTAPVPGSTLDLQRQRASATAGVNWEIKRDSDNVVVHRFHAENQDEAIGRATDFARMQGWNLNDYTVQAIEPTQQPASGSLEYELYRISDGRVVTAPAGNAIRFRADSPEDAESKIARYAADFNLGAPQLFAVRSVLNVPQPQQNSLPGGPSYTVVNDPRDAAQGGIIDVATDHAVNPLWQDQPPELNFGEFTGQWKVLVNGREVYRFGGVGNSQADANRVAAQWLRQNGQGVSGEGFEVYPVIAESLQEYKMPQPSHGPGRYRDLNEPLGPETPPTMPAGTVKVDVSDVYDWYKLGQHISNMKGLGQHDFGKGPPSAILSFGDEDLEHQYIQALKKTGLTTTDIDPVDPNQPPGMPRQKTDPTYNVDESNQLTLRDFVVAISPHALIQAYNKSVDVHMVDDILRNISSVKDNIMSLEPGRALILHNGQGTGLGVRRGQGNRLTLATVFPTRPGFRKGKHPTFRVDTGSRS